ncbi:MAG: c-type cytochrome [Thermoanaerobaculia bacterium]
MKNRYVAAIGTVVLLASATPSALLAEDDGAATFKSRCSVCHGADGSGNTLMGKKNGAKALGSAEAQKQSDADMQKVISDGKGKMPAFSSKLTADQITQLVKFIRTLRAK